MIAASALFVAALSFFVEVLTGNMAGLPPPAMFPPLLLIIVNYGAAAILAREAAARRGLRLGGLAVLGLAYGMVNEGLCSKGFFNPRYYSVVDLGFADFGRWGGVNVLWAVTLTVFHAASSIAAPVLFTNALFPGTAGRLSRRTLGVILFAFMADTLLLCVVARADGFWPGAPVLVILAFLVASLVVAALRSPPPSTTEAVVPGNGVLFVSGTVGMAAFMMASGLRRSGPGAALALMLLLVMLYARQLRRLPDLPLRGQVSLACGSYSLPAFASLASGHPVRAGLAIVVMVAAWRRAGGVSRPIPPG